MTCTAIFCIGGITDYWQITLTLILRMPAFPFLITVLFSVAVIIGDSRAKAPTYRQ